MSKLRVQSSATSIDGHGAGPNQDLENPLGVNGPECDTRLRAQVLCVSRLQQTSRVAWHRKSSPVDFDSMLAQRLFLLALAVAVLGSTTQAQQPLPRDTLQLDTAPSAIFSAISHADTTALRQLLGDDLRWVAGSSGAVIGKAQLVAVVAHPFPLVSLGYGIDSLRTWRHGDVATADYRLTTRRTFRHDSIVFTSRGSDVFVWRRGRWELIHHAETWVIRPPATLTLDSVELVPFVGRYQLGAGYIDDVHFVDGHLVAQSTAEVLAGAPGARLISVSRDTFSPDGIAPMIVFERDAGGRVTGYVQQQPDGTITRGVRMGTP